MTAFLSMLLPILLHLPAVLGHLSSQTGSLSRYYRNLGPYLASLEGDLLDQELDRLLTELLQKKGVHHLEATREQEAAHFRHVSGLYSLNHTVNGTQNHQPRQISSDDKFKVKIFSENVDSKRPRVTEKTDGMRSKRSASGNALSRNKSGASISAHAPSSGKRSPQSNTDSSQKQSSNTDVEGTSTSVPRPGARQRVARHAGHRRTPAPRPTSTARVGGRRTPFPRPTTRLTQQPNPGRGRTPAPRPGSRQTITVNNGSRTTRVSGAEGSIPTKQPSGGAGPTREPGGGSRPTKEPGGGGRPTREPGGEGRPTKQPGGGGGQPTREPGGGGGRPTRQPGGGGSRKTGQPGGGGRRTPPPNWTGRTLYPRDWTGKRTGRTRPTRRSYTRAPVNWVPPVGPVPEGGSRAIKTPPVKTTTPAPPQDWGYKGEIPACLHCFHEAFRKLMRQQNPHHNKIALKSALDFARRASFWDRLKRLILNCAINGLEDYFKAPAKRKRSVRHASLHSEYDPRIAIMQEVVMLEKLRALAKTPPTITRKTSLRSQDGSATPSEGEHARIRDHQTTPHPKHISIGKPALIRANSQQNYSGNFGNIHGKFKYTGGNFDASPVFSRMKPWQRGRGRSGKFSEVQGLSKTFGGPPLLRIEDFKNKVGHFKERNQVELTDTDFGSPSLAKVDSLHKVGDLKNKLGNDNKHINEDFGGPPLTRLAYPQAKDEGLQDSKDFMETSVDDYVTPQTPEDSREEDEDDFMESYDDFWVTPDPGVSGGNSDMSGEGTNTLLNLKLRVPVDRGDPSVGRERRSAEDKAEWTIIGYKEPAIRLKTLQTLLKQKIDIYDLYNACTGITVPGEEAPTPKTTRKWTPKSTKQPPRSTAKREDNQDKVTTEASIQTTGQREERTTESDITTTASVKQVGTYDSAGVANTALVTPETPSATDGTRKTTIRGGPLGAFTVPDITDWTNDGDGASQLTANASLLLALTACVIHWVILELMHL